MPQSFRTKGQGASRKVYPVKFRYGKAPKAVTTLPLDDKETARIRSKSFVYQYKTYIDEGNNAKARQIKQAMVSAANRAKAAGHPEVAKYYEESYAQMVRPEKERFAVQVPSNRSKSKVFTSFAAAEKYREKMLKSGDNPYYITITDSAGTLYAGGDNAFRKSAPTSKPKLAGNAHLTKRYSYNINGKTMYDAGVFLTSVSALNAADNLKRRYQNVVVRKLESDNPYYKKPSYQVLSDGKKVK